MRRAESALLVEGPQEARIRRRRADRRSGAASSLRSLRSDLAALGGRRRLAARRAQGRNRRQEPRRASRRADADAAQIDADRPPVDDEAHAARGAAARRREASPPSGAGAARSVPRPAAAGFRARRSRLASNKASIAGLAATIRAGGKRIARRALSASHSGARHCGSKAAAACSRDNTASSAADEGGEWVKVGAREWTSDRRRRMADDSGFIVSESLTPLVEISPRRRRLDLAQG